MVAPLAVRTVLLPEQITVDDALMATVGVVTTLTEIVLVLTHAPLAPVTV